MYLEKFPDYIFNSDGTVYSKLSNKILKPSSTKKDYFSYKLKDYTGKFSTHYASRLFAEAYLENYSNELKVGHIDGNSRNNAPSNLEMITKSESHIRAINKNEHSVHRMFGSANPKSKKVTIKNLSTLAETNFDTLRAAFIFLGFKDTPSRWYSLNGGSNIMANHLITVHESN